MNIQCDVVVVGAGPAGSVSATLLARRGYRVALVERMRFPRHKACAEYLSPGVVDVLRRADLESVLTDIQPFPVSGMEIVSPAGARLRVAYQQDGSPRLACTAPREVLDGALAGQAQSAGVQLVEGVVARGIAWKEGRVFGVTGTLRGKSVTVEAGLTVVADGARSSLSRALGLARRPRWPVRLGLVAHYTGRVELPDGFGQMHVDRGGYCGVAPLGEDRLNVSVVAPSDALRAARLNATDFLERWIDADPRLRALLASCRRDGPVRGVAPVGSRVRRASVPGALLVGDAAGFFDPFTGEGIYRALRGAELVAAAAEGALLGDGDPSVKRQTYDSMRAEAFRGKGAVVRLVQTFVQFPMLMEYALPRLAGRSSTAATLSAVLGDLADPASFLNPRVMWSALRP